MEQNHQHEAEASYRMILVTFRGVSPLSAGHTWWQSSCLYTWNSSFIEGPRRQLLPHNKWTSSAVQRHIGWERGHNGVLCSTLADKAFA